MILVIDNYDSFTWNLVHLIGGLGITVEVVRNDAITAYEALTSAADAIVLSPGPGEPANAGICVDIVRGAVENGMPVFGVCLGHQAIAEATGATIIRANRQMHGKTSRISHLGDGIFAGIPNPFTATRYHSLVADRRTVANSLRITASTEDDGEIMALEHIAAPIAGVQFHPESFASEHGAQLFRNFLALAKTRRLKQ